MTLSAPSISIIIPVYKAERYLANCIDSILAQTYSDFELLLIDDGSPDKSGNICDEYALNYSCIRVIHKSNEGVSASRNLGIKEAKGEWICFIDSDDWIDKEAFKEIMNSIGGKTVDLVIWGIRLISNTSTNDISVPSYGFINDKLHIIEFYIQADIKGYFGSPCNKLYSSRLIKDNMITFDTTLSLFEDSKFNYNYYEHVNSVFAIKKSYYNYRLNHNEFSLSNKYPDNYLEVRQQYTDMRVNFYSSYNGIYKEKFNNLIKKENELSYILLTLSMYKTKTTRSTRRISINKIIKSNNLEDLKGTNIYYVLKSNNITFIDLCFNIRHWIVDFLPRCFNYYGNILNVVNVRK
jgi:glycosyltransferase involved in cell wall biosynthesis